MLFWDVTLIYVVIESAAFWDVTLTYVVTESAAFILEAEE
jgi:hypothetical protein